MGDKLTKSLWLIIVGTRKRERQRASQVCCHSYSEYCAIMACHTCPLIDWVRILFFRLLTNQVRTLAVPLVLLETVEELHDVSCIV